MTGFIGSCGWALSRVQVLDDHRGMKLRQTLASLFVSHTCWAASVTYLVSENAGACHEVRVPKWSRPTTRSDEPWPISTWGCQYDLRAPSQGSIYIGLSCGSPSMWKMKERYSLDLAKPGSVGPIDEASWNAAPVLEPNFPRPPEQATYQADGLRYRDHLLAKSGPNWDLYAKAAVSPGESRVAVFSYDGIVQRSYEFSFQPERFDGTYWTEIYDVASGKRLIHIHGKFKRVDLTELQGKSYWYSGRFFVEPLETDGMHRLLVCDVDAAATSSGVTGVDAPVPLSRAKPYLNHTRSEYQMRFLDTNVPQAQVVAFRDEPVMCPGSTELIKSVNVTAVLDVQVPGTYSLQLGLHASNGQHSRWQFGQAEVHPGKDEITVSFPGNLLRLWLKSDGPLTVESGQLIRHVSDGQYLAQNVTVTAATRAYSIGRIASVCP
jgi:hypothetical protein